MRHFERDEWYYDGYTWCGVDNSGISWYPFSFGDNGCSWCMNKNINDCLDLGTVSRVRKQLRAEIKRSPVFFRHRYKKFFLVHIKTYPTFYFDYMYAARQLKIKLDPFATQENIIIRLSKYGFVPISDNPKVIEVNREEINLDEFCERASTQREKHRPQMSESLSR